jgi:hypothetical protein
MRDRVPSPEALREVRLQALSCFHAARQLRDAEHRMRGFSPRERSTEKDKVVKEYRRAHGEWHAARHRLDSFHSTSGWKSPYGWTPSVTDTLHRIAWMLEWLPDFIFDWPDEIAGLEAEIDSLAAAATEACSREEVTEREHRDQPARADGSHVPPRNEERDRFIYDERSKSPPTPWKDIVDKVNRHADWEHFKHPMRQGRIDAASKALNHYCERHPELPKPIREHGKNRRK